MSDDSNNQNQQSQYAYPEPHTTIEPEEVVEAYTLGLIFADIQDDENVEPDSESEAGEEEVEFEDIPDDSAIQCFLHLGTFSH